MTTLDSDFPMTELGDLAATVDYGLTASAAESGSAQFLRITDLQNGSVDWASVPRCECSVGDRKKFALAPGDIVFARTGATTGKSFLIRECPSDAVFASYLIRVRPKQDIDPSYLAHFLDTPFYWAQIAKSSVGAAQGGVNATKLKKLVVPKPDLSVQRRIAAILDKAEDIRRKRQQAIALIEDLHRSTFLEMFGDPVLNPNGWPERRLDECAEVVSGVTKGRKLVGKRLETVPYLRVANVQDGHLNLEEVKCIDVLPSDIAKYALQVGDVLLTEGGDPDKLGRGAVWQGQIDPCIHQNHIFRVRISCQSLLSDYLSALIGSSRGKRYFLRAAKQTTGIASINSRQLKSFPVLIPPIDVQQSYVNQLKGIRAMITSHEGAARLTNDLRGSLSQRAFRGEL